jgi:hypothetical protein
MHRLAHTLRSRIDDRRSRREIEFAIANAGSRALRDELITVVQRNGSLYGR